MSDLQHFLTECVFPKLSARQVNFVMYRQKDVFGFGENSKTYRAIALQEGISIERARQITHKGKAIISRRLQQIQEAQKSPHVIVQKVSEAEMHSNLPMRQKFVCDLGDLSVRTINCLKNENLMLVDKLIEKTEVDLLRVPNFGRKSLNELKVILSKHGLEFEKGHGKSGLVISWPSDGNL